MRKFLNMLQKDENAYSIGKLAAVAGIANWLVVSDGLAAFGKTWDNYDTFTWACIALVIIQLCNKTVEIVKAFLEFRREKKLL